MSPLLIDWFWIGLFFIHFKGCGCLFAPTYVSDWFLMDSRNSSTTYKELTHNLGVVPIKVELQVRSPDTGFIYPGVKSAQTDDTTPSRGGVFCYYTLDKVFVVGAMDSVTSSAYVIFTGNSSWLPINRDISFLGYVRARAWHPDDFPPPTMTFAPFLMSVETNGIKYKTVTHGLGHVPAMTIVQLEYGDVYFEGLGSNDHPSSNPATMLWGGLVYGVGPSDIRFWIPHLGNLVKGTYVPNGAMFSFCNGWGFTTTRCLAFACNVRVKMWDALDTLTLFSHTPSDVISTSDTSVNHTYTINNPEFNVDTDLVRVTVGAIDGNNTGFYFGGTGAAMLDTAEGCGGLIYAYTSSTVHLWYPVVNSAFIIKVGPGVGEETNLQFSKSASVSIVIWKGLKCITPASVPFTTMNNTRRWIQYECIPPYVHVSGDLVRTCLDNDTWTGIPPICEVNCEPLIVVNQNCTENTTELCSYPSIGTNAYINVTSLVPGSVVEYACASGNVPIGGNTTRQCQPDLTWTGSPLLCEVLCQPPEIVPNAEYSVSSEVLHVGTVATYMCINGTEMEHAPVHRVCHGSGSWTGIAPVCTVLPVVDEANSTDVTMNITEVLLKAEELSANLTVPTKSTSKYKRSLVSVYDERRSTFHLGIGGVVAILLSLGLLVFNDVIKVIRVLYLLLPKTLKCR